MNFSTKECTIRLDKNTLSFSGKLEMIDYTDLKEYLEIIDKNISMDLIKIDIKKLRYLDSNGIHCLALFFINSTKKIEIYINEDISWQSESITGFAMAKPDKIKIIS